MTNLTTPVPSFFSNLSTPVINLTTTLLLNTTISTLTQQSEVTSTSDLTTTLFFKPTTEPNSTTNTTIPTNHTMNYFTPPPLEILPTGIIKALAVAILIIFTVFGNLLVIISFALFTNIRSLTNYFILSLSCADLLSACLVMPVWLGVQLYNSAWPRYPDDIPLLKTYHCFDLTLSTAGALSLTLISIERNLAITNPFCYTKWFSAVRVLFAIGSAWVIAIVCAVLLVTGWIKNLKVILVLVTVPCYILPFTIMLIMYSKILIVARRQARRLRQNGAYANDLKAMKTIAIVVGLYFLCYTPNFLVLLWTHEFRIRVHEDFMSVARWLSYFNSCCNPVIYSCFNKTYRKSFKRLLKICGKRLHTFRRENSSTANNNKLSNASRTTQTRMSMNNAMRSSAGSLLDGPKTAITTAPAVAHTSDVMLMNDARNSVLCQRISQIVMQEPPEEQQEQKEEIAHDDMVESTQ